MDVLYISSIKGKLSDFYRGIGKCAQGQFGKDKLVLGRVEGFYNTEDVICVRRVCDGRKTEVVGEEKGLELIGDFIFDNL